jgi:PEGA domain
MRSRTLPGSLLLLFILFSGLRLQALEDTRETYTVAVTAFSSLGLPREHRYLSQTLPRLMLHTLTGLGTHRYGAEEKTAWRGRLLEEALRGAEIDLAALRLSASKAFLSNGTPASDVPALSDGLKLFEELRAESGADILIAGEKRITILNQSGEIPALPEDPAVYCRTNKADMLISGRIEAIGDLVYFSLSAYSFAAGRWKQFFSSAGGFTSLEEALVQARGSLREQVLGRPWSSLTLRADRDDARIYVDGEPEGLGTLRELIVEPGDHLIRIESEAAEVLETRISTAPGEEVERDFSLTLLPPDSLGISTLPAGADVYLSSLRVGQTPLFLPPGGRTGTLRLSYEGYRDVLIPAGNLDAGKNSFNLERSYYDPALRFQQKRDSLYTAVGLFTLALPVSFFSYSLFRDYQNQGVLLGEQELSDRAFLYNGLFYGSLYTTAVLFVNMVRSLAEYRRAGDETF